MNDSYKNTSAFIIDQTQLTLPLEAHALPVQVIKYDLTKYTDSLYSTFEIEQPSELDLWVAKRKAQFLTGRLASRQALKAIGAKDETIHIGKYREPLWSKNIIGSISHDDGISIATAQIQTSANQEIGIDIQTILNDQEISSSANIVLTRNDKKLLKKMEERYSYSQLFTLLFSAKESFFKAVFKEVGQHFDFDVMTLKSVDFEAQILLLKCEKTISDNIVSDSEYALNFTYLDIDKSPVITACLYK